MKARELFLLSPYRLPTHQTGMLGNDEVAAFLNGYSALWHPAVARNAAGPPRIASQYDHEQPSSGHIYAVPVEPPLFLPEDWHRRATDIGAIVFRSTPDRLTTLTNLKEGLEKATTMGQPTDENPQGSFVPSRDPWLLSPEQVGPFYGLAFGYLLIGALCEAMDHDNLLNVIDFWEQVQQAMAAQESGRHEAGRGFLQEAARKLQTAREVLYPVSIYLLNMQVLDEGWNADALNQVLEGSFPVNLVGYGSVWEKLAREQPEQVALLRKLVHEGKVEVCGGSYVERDDALLPTESQLWNLVHGLNITRQIVGGDISVYGCKHLSGHPQLPLVLAQAGLRRALLVAFDETTLPNYRTPVINWSTTNGNQLDAFTRMPFPADTPQTFFNLAHYLHQTIIHDHAATIGIVHKGLPPSLWYSDWLELSRLGPILGTWKTMTQYFNEVVAGEQISAVSPDDFQADALSQPKVVKLDQRVSWFTRHARQRRQIDTTRTLAALDRSLAGVQDHLLVEARLDEFEGAVENGGDRTEELAIIQQEAAEALARRLLSRAQVDTPGFLVLNPCSFTRRVALEIKDAIGPLPIMGALKACQTEGDLTRLVVEVPALGFAWVPRNGPPGTAAQSLRMKLADERHVRNEFFEAEIDPATGGLRGLWDQRTRVSRLGQQLIYNPGSTMRTAGTKVMSTGPALGEVVSEGSLVDNQNQVLATFRQRFRAWLGRPVLELRLEIFPQHLPNGYPWHAYYGSRFAWRNERNLLLRGVGGAGHVTSHTRPVTADFLELRQGHQNAVIFPGGLPFHQRHGARMLDIILIPEGEKARSFDLGIALDRDHPMQTAQGLITPTPIVPTDRGPPHVGATGWLFHLDAPNLLLTGMRPGPNGAHAIVARMQECSLQSGQAELRCVRNPTQVCRLDAWGEKVGEAAVNGDAVIFDYSQGDLMQFRVDFSQ